MTQFNRSMTAGERLPFQIDVGQRVVTPWSPNSIYEVSTYVRPIDGNETGFIYVNPAEGQSGPLEPAWVSPDGSYTQDGSLNWLAVIPPAAEDTISNVSCTQLTPPDGALIISGLSFTDLIVTVFLGGGTSGAQYTVNCVITMQSGSVYIAQILLAVQ